MRVYVIYGGSVYEGGGIDLKAYRDYDKARQVALEAVAEEQAADDKLYARNPDKPIYEWEEKNKDHWSNGLEEVKLLTLPLV